MSRMLKALMILAAAVCTAAAQDKPIDGYAAVVNDRVITMGDVLAFIQPVQEQLQGSYTGRELEFKLQEAFDAGRDALIEKALILEDFEAMEGAMPDHAVDEHVSNIIQERFDSDRAAFLEALAQERLSLQEWREQIKEQLIVMVLRRQLVAARATISPKALHDLYLSRQDTLRIPAMTKVRMIVLNRGGSEEEDLVKREEAENILASLRGGADFAATATAESEGQKAAAGGDWGWIEPATLRPELAGILGTLGAGEISDVIETPDAYYIVMAEAKRAESVRSFEEARPDLERELRRDEEKKLYDAWIARLKEKNYVKVY